MNKEISNAYISVLRAIYTLDREGYILTSDGLAYLLVGDYRLEDLKNSAAYSYFSSISTRKIKNRIHYLIRYGYLKLEFKKDCNLHFLLLTEKALSLELKPLIKRDVKEDNLVYYLKKGKE